ncbi:hypothetical protein PoB_004756700 [Plakobranchus ocellatus]|uniref:Uncharacterized protein n=1 Tax=Plakobranchus ocellatus TaxID=259542 RepID=A0AAV4BQ22_9GAST|nr:hypothetical protein PoB_004756700 [Plakobranchus ocellatus]
MTNFEFVPQEQQSGWERIAHLWDIVVFHTNKRGIKQTAIPCQYRAMACYIGRPNNRINSTIDRIQPDKPSDRNKHNVKKQQGKELIAKPCSIDGFVDKKTSQNWKISGLSSKRYRYGAVSCAARSNSKSWKITVLSSKRYRDRAVSCTAGRIVRAGRSQFSVASDTEIEQSRNMFSNVIKNSAWLEDFNQKYCFKDDVEPKKTNLNKTKKKKKPQAFLLIDTANQAPYFASRCIVRANHIRRCHDNDAPGKAANQIFGHEINAVQQTDGRAPPRACLHACQVGTLYLTLCHPAPPRATLCHRPKPGKAETGPPARPTKPVGSRQTCAMDRGPMAWLPYSSHQISNK